MKSINKNQFLQQIYAQSGELPQELLALLGQEFGAIEHYSLADIQLINKAPKELKFVEIWCVLTEKAVLIFEEINQHWQLTKKLPMQKISKIKELGNLSYYTLIFTTADDCPPLATLRYSGRQKINMDNLKYLIEQKIKYPKKRQERDSVGAKYHENYAHHVLKNYIDAQNNDVGKKAQTLWRLLSYLKAYKAAFIFGAIGAILTTVVSLAPAMLSGYLIDKIIGPFQRGQLEQNAAWKMAWIVVASIGFFGVTKEFFNWIRLNKMSIIGEWVAKDLREELYTHLQRLGLDFYSSKQTGSIISRVSSDTDRIWDFMAFGVVEVGIALVSLTGLSTALIYLDWRLGLIMTIPIPFLLYCIYVHGETMQKLFIKAWRKWADLTNVLADTIPGIQVVKAFGQEQRETSRFNQSNEITTHEFNHIHRQWTKFWPILMLGIHGVLMSTWVFAIPRLLLPASHEGYLSAGTFVSFLLYMTMFSQPIEVIGQMSRMLNRALSSAYRIFEILDTRPSMVDSPNAKTLTTVQGHIEFKNVDFSYDGVRKILKNIDFQVCPGEMIGLVGQSGGGKSTISKLINRFYDVDEGEVLLDGENIKNLERSSLRKNIGMVLQDPYLFHGNILENIRYGNPSAKLSQVVKMAKMANAHEFIMKLPHAYQTIVGERGHTLSGGERQRVSIARALLSDPKILILDEATSAVDTETERKIQNALDNLVQGRTVIAIAHRLSTLRNANRIFVIADGKIVEQGTHHQLLAKKHGEYKKLCSMQEELGQKFTLK